MQPPRRRLGFAESVEEVRKVFTALWQDSDQHQHHANHKTSGMNDHGVPAAGRIGKQGMTLPRFCSARPDQYGEHQDAPQHLERVRQCLLGSESVDGLKVVGEMLDLAWKHGADGKDPAHAQGLTWIPGRQKLMAHWLNGARSGSGGTGQQTRRANGKQSTNR